MLLWFWLLCVYDFILLWILHMDPSFESAFLPMVEDSASEFVFTQYQTVTYYERHVKTAVNTHVAQSPELEAEGEHIPQGRQRDFIALVGVRGDSKSAFTVVARANWGISLVNVANLCGLSWKLTTHWQKIILDTKKRRLKK